MQSTSSVTTKLLYLFVGTCLAILILLVSKNVGAGRDLSDSVDELSNSAENISNTTSNLKSELLASIESLQQQLVTASSKHNALLNELNALESIVELSDTELRELIEEEILAESEQLPTSTRLAPNQSTWMKTFSQLQTLSPAERRMLTSVINDYESLISATPTDDDRREILINLLIDVSALRFEHRRNVVLNDSSREADDEANLLTTHPDFHLEMVSATLGPEELERYLEFQQGIYENRQAGIEAVRAMRVK